VKANPSPDLLRVLWDAGVTHYDVASITEVRLVRSVLPEATLCFMHPVKAPRAIAEAYKTYGVRTFSLDRSTNWKRSAKPPMAPGSDALRAPARLFGAFELSLASKFGCDLVDARELLQQTRQLADSLGVCFHVGSQAMSPHAYVLALEKARAAIVDAAVTVDIIDVGGGFRRSIRAWSLRRSKTTSR
jgi:ornithine decarboxylase